MRITIELAIQLQCLSKRLCMPKRCHRQRDRYSLSQKLAKLWYIWDFHCFPNLNYFCLSSWLTSGCAFLYNSIKTSWWSSKERRSCRTKMKWSQYSYNYVIIAFTSHLKINKLFDLPFGEEAIRSLVYTRYSNIDSEPDEYKN